MSNDTQLTITGNLVDDPELPPPTHLTSTQHPSRTTCRK